VWRSPDSAFRDGTFADLTDPKTAGNRVTPSKLYVLGGAGWSLAESEQKRIAGGQLPDYETLPVLDKFAHGRQKALGIVSSFLAENYWQGAVQNLLYFRRLTNPWRLQ
jgi:hypothetical protein